MIFSTHPLHPSVTARLQARARYVVATSPTGQAILDEGLEAEVLIVRAPIPPEFFGRATHLRGAVRHGAGLDMIPVDAATKAGVLVANVPGANASTVAEHVIFAAIGLRRQFRAMDHAFRSGGWAAGRAFSDHGRDLAGATLGIYGYGNIGREVGRLASAFGMRIQATTRRSGGLPPGISSVDLDQLVATSDVLVLCCPLSDETRGTINSEKIGAMKPDAVIINVSRGPVIDGGALLNALRSRRILGAALDVFDSQPLLPDDPLLLLDNAILTPHMAGITEDSMLRMGDGAAAETVRILDNHLPMNFCNPEVETLYRARFPA